jgi:S1-C subfamily serine protease
MSTSLSALSNDLANVVEAAGRAVVAVHGRPRGGSSGVLWKPGLVVTAEHSLRREDDIRVTLPNGTTVSAELAGADPGTDLAVLKLPAEDHPVIEAAAAPMRGAIVLAVGRTRETGPNATLGIVSALGPGWNTWRGGHVDQYVRLDLHLYSGSTGGAIVDFAGKVIGIATPALSRIAPLAIPAATVDRILAALLEKGRIPRPYLGVGLQPIALPEHLKERLDLKAAGGLIVLTIEEGAAAASAGVLIGDIVVAIDGEITREWKDLQAVLSTGSVGRRITLTIIRGGEKRDLNLLVGEKSGGGR